MDALEFIVFTFGSLVSIFMLNIFWYGYLETTDFEKQGGTLYHTERLSRGINILKIPIFLILTILTTIILSVLIITLIINALGWLLNIKLNLKEKFDEKIYKGHSFLFNLGR